MTSHTYILLKCGESILIKSKDGINFDSVLGLDQLYFTRYPVLLCEQNKAIGLADLLMKY